METPENINQPYFTLQVKHVNKNTLSTAAIELLKAVESRPKLTESYRMEVEFDREKKLVIFKISLNPVLWYDVYLRRKSSEVAVQIARNYITTTRKSIPPEDDGPFYVEYSATEKKKAFTICRDHINKKECGKKDCEYGHPKIYCRAKITTRDGREDKCDFYFADNLIIVISGIKITGYILMIRREPFRELLLLPHPSHNHLNHFNNEQMAKSGEFWELILRLQEMLDFHLIAFNFGQWETAQAYDRYAQECHGHIHLYFNKETWDKLKDNVDNSTRSKLYSRNYPGPNYLLMNCMELERERLQSLESQCLLNMMTDMKDTMVDMKDNIKDSNEKIIEALNKILLKN